MSEIGARLRTLREGIGLSQAKFGKIAGIPQATINRLNEGRSIEQGNWTVQYFYPYFISKSLIFQAFLFLRCNCKIGRPVSKNQKF